MKKANRQQCILRHLKTKGNMHGKILEIIKRPMRKKKTSENLNEKNIVSSES